MSGPLAYLMPFRSMMPFAIPIVVIVGAFAAGIVAMFLKSKANELAHRERMFMAEKGLEIPRELYNIQEKKPPGFRAARAWLLVMGVVSLIAGTSVLIVVSVQEGIHVGINGIIGIVIGLGFLACERLIARLA